MKKSWSVLIILISLSIIGLVVLTVLQKDSGKQNDKDDDTSQLSESSPITVKGEVVCLPHDDTTGPQTLECAIGLLAEDGTYYALNDTTSDYSLVSKTPMGEPVSVTGTLTLEESDTYQSIGTIDVTAIEQF